MTLLLLLIKFYDELHYGIQSAVLPALRSELALDYAQVGLLLGLTTVIATFLEPVIMLLGDTRLRKGLVIAGANAFPLLLLAFVLGPLLISVGSPSRCVRTSGCAT